MPKLNSQTASKILLFVGSLDARNAQDRRRGIIDALRGSWVRLVDTYTDETDKAKAKSNVTEALRKHRDLACLVGLWSYNGPAILSAVRDAHKVGKVKIIAFDEEDETLAGVKSGAITSTIVQQPFEFGYLSIMMLAKYLWGDTAVVPPSHIIVVPTKVVNRANVNLYWAELNRLRGH